MSTLYTIKKFNWIGDSLRRNCLLKHNIEGKIAGIVVTERGGRRGKQLLDDLQEREDTRNRKRKKYIALCVELALEEAVDLS
jgi:hypothetical protein